MIDELGRKYLVRATRKPIHTDLGVVDLGSAIGIPFGDKLKSHMGREFTVLQPRMSDILQKIRRLPQIVLPKDAAQIVAYTGVGPGDRVVDGGTGSGSLAIFLGNLVKPGGRVVSYEVREDFARVAMENVRMAGLEKIIEIKLKDICEGIEEEDLDLVTLDIPTPEKVLPHAEVALKPGGYLAAFTPCIEHVQRLYSEFPAYKFTNLKTIECLVREFEVKPGATRPKTRMVAHTGYLTFARRV